MNSKYFYTQDELNFFVFQLTIEAQEHLIQCFLQENEDAVDKAWLWLTQTPLLEVYACTVRVKDLYFARAELARFVLQAYGYQLEDDSVDICLEKEVPSQCAVYLSYVSSGTESRATYPYLQALREQGLNITVCTPHCIAEEEQSDFTRNLLSLADNVLYLPSDIQEQVKVLKARCFDLLLFANNTTAVMNNSFLVASHRIAALQMVHFCQPCSTYLPQADVFILGDNLAIDYTKEFFTEEILKVQGSGIRFAESREIQPASKKWTYEECGIPYGAKIIVSGANLYKLSPLARECFVRILAASTETHLLLYPFGPAWSDSYPIEDFLSSLRDIFHKYGVDANRCHILQTLPAEGDVLEVLKLSYLYLDSFPHSGATSLLDPLRVNLPCLCLEGDTLLSCQAAGLLKDLGLEELIAKSEEEFIAKALRIIDHKETQKYLSQKIDEVMQKPAVYEYQDMVESLKQGIQKAWDKKRTTRLFA